MKKTLLLVCLTAFFLSGCGTMNMRKISVEPKIPTGNTKTSSLKAGLLLSEQFTNYTYTFETGTQIFLLAGVTGEIEVGKNLSQALYGIVSGKFGNVALAHEASEIHDVDVYFVPRIKFFKYAPAFTGLSSHTAEVEMEVETFAGDGKLVRAFNIKQEGSRSALNQISMETNYESARYAVNEAIDNLLMEFFRKLNEYY